MQLVGPSVAAELVSAQSAIQRVVAWPADHSVVASAGLYVVRTIATVDVVVARFSADRVVACAARELVIAEPTV